MEKEMRDLSYHTYFIRVLPECLLDGLHSLLGQPIRHPMVGSACLGLNAITTDKCIIFFTSEGRVFVTHNDLKVENISQSFSIVACEVDHRSLNPL